MKIWLKNLTRCFALAPIVIACLALVPIAVTHAQDDPYEELNWEFGPTEGAIGNKAEIHVPDGYAFLGAEDTKKFMEVNENFASGKEYVFAPDDLSWFAVFEFDPSGYVEDNETLDADSLLDSATRGTEAGNIERRKRGWGTMSIKGWRFQPRYDDQNNMLEWAILAQDDASQTDIINYNTRLLGRTGVMQVVLVADPETLGSSVVSLKQALSKYDFVAGERYAEFREGDRVAEYGLAALIAGGAAAVATKKGFWAATVAFMLAAKKFVLVAVIGLFAWIGSLLKRKS